MSSAYTRTLNDRFDIINIVCTLEVCDYLRRYLRLSRYLFNIEIKIIGFIIEILVIFCILLCTTLNI